MDRPDLAAQIEQIGHALTAPALAKLLGYGRATIYEMTSTGRIPYIRIGATIRYDPYHIAQWLRDCTVATGR